jgi:hypothetical protein
MAGLSIPGYKYSTTYEVWVVPSKVERILPVEGKPRTEDSEATLPYTVICFTSGDSIAVSLSLNEVRAVLGL